MLEEGEVEVWKGDRRMAVPEAKLQVALERGWRRTAQYPGSGKGAEGLAGVDELLSGDATAPEAQPEMPATPKAPVEVRGSKASSLAEMHRQQNGMVEDEVAGLPEIGPDEVAGGDLPGAMRSVVDSVMAPLWGFSDYVVPFGSSLPYIADKAGAGGAVEYREYLKRQHPNLYSLGAIGSAASPVSAGRVTAGRMALSSLSKLPAAASKTLDTMRAGATAALAAGAEETGYQAGELLGESLRDAELPDAARLHDAAGNIAFTTVAGGALGVPLHLAGRGAAAVERATETGEMGRRLRALRDAGGDTHLIKGVKAPEDVAALLRDENMSKAVSNVVGSIERGALSAQDAQILASKARLAAYEAGAAERQGRGVAPKAEVSAQKLVDLIHEVIERPRAPGEMPVPESVQELAVELGSPRLFHGLSHVAALQKKFGQKEAEETAALAQKVFNNGRLFVAADMPVPNNAPRLRSELAAEAAEMRRQGREDQAVRFEEWAKNLPAGDAASETVKMLEPPAGAVEVSLQQLLDMGYDLKKLQGLLREQVGRDLRRRRVLSVNERKLPNDYARWVNELSDKKTRWKYTGEPPPPPPEGKSTNPGFKGARAGGGAAAESAAESAGDTKFSIWFAARHMEPRELERTIDALQARAGDLARQGQRKEPYPELRGRAMGLRGMLPDVPGVTPKGPVVKATDKGPRVMRGYPAMMAEEAFNADMLRNQQELAGFPKRALGKLQQATRQQGAPVRARITDTERESLRQNVLRYGSEGPEAAPERREALEAFLEASGDDVRQLRRIAGAVALDPLKAASLPAFKGLVGGAGVGGYATGIMPAAQMRANAAARGLSADVGTAGGLKAITGLRGGAGYKMAQDERWQESIRDVAESVLQYLDRVEAEQSEEP